MKLFAGVLLTGIWVFSLAASAMDKRPEPPSENCAITGDIVSMVLVVNPDGTITPEPAEISPGTQVALWLSENILAIDEDLLASHVGINPACPLWPSAPEPPLWIGDAFEPPLTDFLSIWLTSPEEYHLTGWEGGRFFFGEVQLLKDISYTFGLDMDLFSHSQDLVELWSYQPVTRPEVIPHGLAPSLQVNMAPDN